MMDYLNKDDRFYLNETLKLARRAFEEDEVPVGAVIVSGDKIIGKGYNQVERLKDVTAHAEMLAITAACNFLGSKYLFDSVLYVNLEPCPMCLSAAKWAKIPRIVFGAEDSKKGFSRVIPVRFWGKTEMVYIDSMPECGDILKSFFNKKRNI